MTNRTFLALDIKAVDGDQRRFEGIATTPEVDRQGDVVVPEGVVYTLPLPFLLDHDHKQAVGEVDYVEVTPAGIKFRARIAKITEPGDAKDLCDKAWALIKNGLRRAVSIGFRPLDREGLPGGGWRFKSWEWLELSAVSVPAAPSATITGAKRMAAIAASADNLRVIRTRPRLTPQERQRQSEERIRAWARAQGFNN